ncbi:MAG: TPM domain-containing protein [Peptococcales bacterium]|jgi:uncharacterized protein
MVKKNFLVKIASLFLLVFLFSSIGYLSAEKNLVNDLASSFTSDEISQLTQAARVLGEKYSIDIVIVTTQNAEGKSSRAYADDFLEDNGYGRGEERDGILFLVDFDNGEAYISTSGSGIRYLTDERIELVLDRVFEKGLADGNIFGAASAFLSSVGEFLERGIPQDQYNEPEITGNTLTFIEGAFGAVVSAITGLGFFSIIRNKYKSRPGTRVFEYRQNSHINLSITNDNLINTYVTTRIIPKTTPPKSSSGGKSTTHRSSSGRTHGGGGRKF